MKMVGLICVAFLVSCYASVRAAEQQFTTQAVKGDQLVLPMFVRVDRPFNRGWTYHLEGSGTSRTVDLPHDYQFEQPWTQKGGGARGFKACGTKAVYTNSFDYDPAWDGKRVYLEFEAIMSSGEVEVNGKKVGECDYGYVGCTLDVTDKLVKDKPNTVKVSCTTGAQKGSRWYTGGGLMRPVHLIVKSPVSIVEDGVFVRTEGEQVKVQVQLDGYRGLGRKNELKIEATIKDADGAVVGSGETVAPWSKLRHQLVELNPIAVKAPKLWDITSPNLYTCEVKLVLNGAEIDQVSDRFGFRTVEFSKDFGFKLNGRKVWLVGMANHHDLGALGAAAFDDGIRRMMRTIKSFGYNTLRCSHNPFSKGFYRIADEEGLLVIDELYDKWGFAGGNWWIGSKPQRETWPVHMKRWMMRDRNHPSVILWSLGNEFQMNEDICGYDTDDWGITTYRMMREYARRYDPTRLTTVAIPARAGAVGKNDPKDLYESYDPPELATVTDVSSFNYQPHAYRGYLERAPWMTVFQSEATTSEGLKAMNLMDREKMVGLCYWGAIEYWGESNKWPKKGWNYSFFSHTLEPFPRAWLIQSGAEPEKPLVHLGIVEKGGEMTSWNEQKSGQERIRENWTRTPGEKVTVVVYSNQDEVELFLNGKSLGKKSVPHGATESANTVRYTDVLWEPGELKAVAGPVSHTIRSAGPVGHLKVTVDYEGEELIYARIVGVDADGRENLAATGKVQVTVSGGGTLYALDNGDHYTDELFTSDITAKDLHDGTLQVIVRKTPGATEPVTINAEFLVSSVVRQVSERMLSASLDEKKCVKDSRFNGLLAGILSPIVADKAYLFSYFSNKGHGGRRGESSGLHLAYSYDGKTWTALNNDEPLLVPEIGKDKLMRDPSICRGPDGTFHLVWTSSWKDRIIGYASSKDLIRWSEQKAIPVMAHEPTARNCWAPELTYNPDDGLFYIYWATTIPGRHSVIAGIGEREDGLNHRIYLTTTKDFVTFSPTRLWFNPSFNVIDAAVIRDPQAKDWIMFVKNENHEPVEKNIRMTRTTDLAAGFPTEVSAKISPDKVEGPAPLWVGESLYVYMDYYRQHRFGAVRTDDHGQTWKDVSKEVSFPKGIRHGTAFAVDKAFVEDLVKRL